MRQGIKQGRECKSKQESRKYPTEKFLRSPADTLGVETLGIKVIYEGESSDPFSPTYDIG